jgi:hypothetical protein
MGKVLQSFKLGLQDAPFVVQPITGSTGTPCDITDVEGNKAYFNQLCVGSTFFPPAIGLIAGDDIGQTVNPSAFTPVVWPEDLPGVTGGLDIFNNGGSFVFSGPNQGIQVTNSGLYWINADVRFVGGTALWGVGVLINGVQQGDPFDSQESVVITWQFLLALHADDIVNLAVQTTGTPTTLQQVSLSAIFIGYV